MPCRQYTTGTGTSNPLLSRTTSNVKVISCARTLRTLSTTCSSKSAVTWMSTAASLLAGMRSEIERLEQRYTVEAGEPPPPPPPQRELLSQMVARRDSDIHLAK